MGDLVRLDRPTPRHPVRVVADLRDLVEPWTEVDAIGEQGEKGWTGVLTAARLIQVALVAGDGHAIARFADALEREAPKQQQRFIGARLAAKRHLAELNGATCPDGVAAPAHGKAA